jgi:AhpD family alkylhydroperoxidase
MRISEKALAHYPWYVRLLLRLQRRKYGRILKPSLLWGRSPLLFLAMGAMFGVFERKRSPLDPVLRSLVMTRVSQINSCQFCVDFNSAALATRAGSSEKIPDERERVALEYAEAMSISGRTVGDDLFARLSRQFDDDAIVELTALVAFQNLSSKFNAALHVPAQGFCELSERKTERPANVKDISRSRRL